MHKRSIRSCAHGFILLVTLLLLTLLPLRFAFADEPVLLEQPAQELEEESTLTSEDNQLDAQVEAESIQELGDVSQETDQATDIEAAPSEIVEPETALQESNELALEPMSSTALDFLYVHAESVEVGDTQYIVAAVPEDLIDVASASLTLHYEDGTSQTLQANDVVDGAALFSLANNATHAGLVEVESISFTFVNGFELSYLVSSLGIEAHFTFNSAPLDVIDSFEETIEGVDVSAELLADTDPEDEPALMAMASSQPIIALDPGHGGYDSGAVGNGVVERDTNWKITMACKAELERLGAQVVVVVSETEFKNYQAAPVSLKARAERADAAGAAVLVSMHINSSAASAQGHMMLIPSNSSYNQHTYTDGVDLSKKVRARLTALGLKDNGNLFRTYEAYYADGKSPADYYGIVREARKLGMLGVIVEHAFLTNSSDAAKLKKDSFLTSLGKADAAAIWEKYYGSQSGIVGIDVSSRTVKVGTPVTISPRLIGNTSGAKFNYTWRWMGKNDWSLWGSYKKSNKNAYSKSTSYTFTPSKTGTYRLTIDYVDASGKITYVTTDIEVTSSSSWDVVALNASAYNISVGDTITYKAVTSGDVSGAQYNYVWRLLPGWTTWGSNKKDTGKYTTATSGSFTPTKAGTYTLSVDVIKGSVKKTVTAQVTVKAKSSSSSDSTTWNITAVKPSATTVEVGTKVTFTPVTTGNVSGAEYNYVWRLDPGWTTWGSNKKDTGSYTTATSGSFTPTKAGTYYLSIDLIKGGVKKTATTSITVTPSSWSATGLKVSAQSVAQGTTVTLTPTTTGNVSGAEYNYGWNYDGGWSNWNSTKLATGSYTKNTSSSYTFYMPGTYDVWVDVIKNGVKKTVSQTITVTATKTPIMGSTKATKAKLVADLMAGIKSRGGSYPAIYKDKGAATPEKFIDLLWEEALKEGVRPEVLYAQVVIETGYLQFGGSVKAEQCNFGGIGATGGSATGASFDNVRMGLRAQVQHLMAYASTATPKNKVIDPRFNYVTRGCAPNVEDLTGRWAVAKTPYDQVDYGGKLIRIMKQVGAY